MKGFGRLLLAAAIGIVVSAFLLATLFEGDVNAEAKAEHDISAKAAVAERAGEVETQSARWAAERIEAEAEIRELASAGLLELRTQVDDLRAQEARLQGELADAEARCIAETAGDGLTGVPGSGTVAALECGRRDAREAELEMVGGQLAALEPQLLAVEGQVATDIEAGLAQWEATNGSDPGLVPPSPPEQFDPRAIGVWERIVQTHELLGFWGSVAATAMLVAVDSLVVVMKLLRGDSAYAISVQNSNRRQLALAEGAPNAAREAKVFDERQDLAVDWELARLHAHHDARIEMLDTYSEPANQAVPNRWTDRGVRGAQKHRRMRRAVLVAAGLALLGGIGYRVRANSAEPVASRTDGPEITPNEEGAAARLGVYLTDDLVATPAVGLSAGSLVFVEAAPGAGLVPATVVGMTDGLALVGFGGDQHSGMPTPIAVPRDGSAVVEGRAAPVKVELAGSTLQPNPGDELDAGARSFRTARSLGWCPAAPEPRASN